MKKPIKEKVAAKKKKLGKKLAAKVKPRKTRACAALALLALLALGGCMETQPASRATTATYGDIIVKIGDDAHDNSVTITLGDGALASADSAGSTETQTATPTMDIKPDIDVNYGTLGGGSAAADFVASLTEASAALLREYIEGRKTGTITLEKKDGSQVVADCVDGTCTVKGE